MSCNDPETLHLLNQYDFYVMSCTCRLPKFLCTISAISSLNWAIKFIVLDQA